MRKTIHKFLLVVLVGVLVVNMFGCNNTNNSNKVAFYNMSKDKQEIYVINHLKKLYQIECSLSSIEKRQVNVFETENHYHTIAYLENDSFDVWIDDEGVIVETYFLISFRSEINSIISGKLDGLFQSMEVFDSAYFNQPPVIKWDVNDNLLDGRLMDENLVHRIRIATNEIKHENIKELLSNYLTGFHGTIDIYVVNNTSIIKSYYDFNAYESSVTVFLD